MLLMRAWQRARVNNGGRKINMTTSAHQRSEKPVATISQWRRIESVVDISSVKSLMSYHM